MPTYTTRLKFIKPSVGETNWGTPINESFTDIVDIAVAGYINVTIADADQTLLNGNGATPNEARNAFINILSSVALTVARNVIVPSTSKIYFIKNSTTGGFAITVKTSAGTGISVLNGTTAILLCDGTNVVSATPSSVGTSTTTQVIYNSSGAAVGSANLIFDGTSLTVNGVKVGRGLYSIASNTAVGNGALAATTTAYKSTAVGNNALAALTQGIFNTAVGDNTLALNVIGNSNTAVGSGAAAKVISSNNTALGYNALRNVTTGSANVGVGADAGYQVVSGQYNVSVGDGSGGSIGAINGNVSVGCTTGSAFAGDNCTAIGYRAASSFWGVSYGGSNITVIGNDALPSGGAAANEITLGNSSVLTLRYYGTLVSLSDARDKTNIQPLVPGLDFINRLNPVSFDWNMRDGGKVGIADTGFLAQDLQSCQTPTESIPSLVFTGNPDRLEASYVKLIPVMVKAIQELTARIAVLEAR
jgi:hypothetical protein